MNYDFSNLTKAFDAIFENSEDENAKNSLQTQLEEIEKLSNEDNEKIKEQESKINELAKLNNDLFLKQATQQPQKEKGEKEDKKLSYDDLKFD